MLPAAITNIHQAFKEIKHMAVDTLQEQCRLAARRAMKEVIEHRMHNTIDAFLEQMRSAGPSKRVVSLPSCDRSGGSGTRDPPDPDLQRLFDLETVCSSNRSRRANDLDVFSARSVHAQGGTGPVVDPGRAGQPLHGQRHCQAAGPLG
jgi:hypothetical protein